jgi:glycosyltransferase involved in cell wall biosynthesis
LRVCFFSPIAYSYFRPDRIPWVGGAETQQVLIARHMLARGIEVSFIVGDYGQPETEIVEGITLIKSFTPFKGNRKLRFIPDMLAIRKAMRRADADIFNQRSTAFFTGQLAYFAAQMKRAFTFSLGLDFNCYLDCRGTLRWPMAYSYRYGIRRADAVIAQTEYQQHLMSANFVREVHLIRNGIAIPSDTPIQPENPASVPWSDGARAGGGDDRPELLWVGRLHDQKRPELFLELARAMPEALCTLIGGYAGNKRYYRRIVDDAKGIPNLRHVEFVPPAEIDVYYQRAYVLVNTSYFEGFPNTFLYAWLRGVPVISIGIDPDSVIRTHSLGVVAEHIEGLIDAARSLCANPSMRAGMSTRASAYVRTHHNIRDRGEDYIRLFEDILSRRAKQASRRSG